MDKSGWFLITSAIAIPLLTALVARAATRYSARLGAAQKKRDLEIAQLTKLQDALLDAASATQSYVFFVEKGDRRQTITTGQWIARRPLFEPAVLKTQRLDSLAITLPSDSELRDLYRQVNIFLMSVLTGNDDGVDAWEEEAKRQPTRISIAMERTARELERLLTTYPVEAPDNI